MSLHKLFMSQVMKNVLFPVMNLINQIKITAILCCKDRSLWGDLIITLDDYSRLREM